MAHLKALLALASITLTSLAADRPAFTFPNSTDPVPYKLAVSPAFVAATKSRAASYRSVSGVRAGWTDEGADSATMSSLARYWAYEYDWDAEQIQINRQFHHYAVTVPGSGNYTQPIPLHFIHERSARAGATPLLLLHGWPSTLLEWREVVAPLVGPTTACTPAFHLVAPDMPGFGFSPAPTEEGLGPRELAAAFDALMRKLWYSRYGVVSTDLGWIVGSWMAVDVKQSVRGHFSDLVIYTPNATDRQRYNEHKTTPEETAYIHGYDAFNTNHTAYQAAHIQKPLAVALSLADSPVGFAGWMWDLVRTASDGYNYTLQTIITDAFLLYLPGVYANVRYYRTFFDPAVFTFPKSDVPTGVSEWAWPNGPFPDLVNFPLVPRSWTERIATVTFFVQHKSGGHFPAISRTDDWVADVRKFFAQTP